MSDFGGPYRTKSLVRGLRRLWLVVGCSRNSLARAGVGVVGEGPQVKDLSLHNDLVTGGGGFLSDADFSLGKELPGVGRQTVCG
jgi:hypothetical protein